MIVRAVVYGNVCACMLRVCVCVCTWVYGGAHGVCVHEWRAFRQTTMHSQHIVLPNVLAGQNQRPPIDCKKPAPYTHGPMHPLHYSEEADEAHVASTHKHRVS